MHLEGRFGKHQSKRLMDGRSLIGSVVKHHSHLSLMDGRSWMDDLVEQSDVESTQKQIQ